MSTKKKIIIASGVIAALGGVTYFSLQASRRDQIDVETGQVEFQDELVAVVSATGEIKPKEYVELQAEISGVITDLYVAEGDRVEKGTLLLRIDPVQTMAETRAQEAVLSATEMEARNQASQIAVQATNVERDLASVRVSEAELANARQNLQLAQAIFDRKQELFEENLISRDVYETAKNDLINAETALTTATARLEQSRAQCSVSKVVLEQAKASHESAKSRVLQQRAILDRNRDILSKTVIRSPLAGVITQLNVEVGERAVPGTLNNPAATLMIIADLSVIEAELEVDETDIVDLELRQKAEVTVDALPDTPIQGIVTEIGNSAIPTASDQEAKDFKVVVQLQDPPKSLRPGLSCTGEITTAIRTNVLTIPIQALTIREFEVDEDGALVRKEKEADKKKVREEEEEDRKPDKEEFEGVFRVEDGEVTFIPVETGIIGETEIEVISGLKDGETIVIGSYKTLRTLADGDAVKTNEKKRG